MDSRSLLFLTLILIAQHSWANFYGEAALAGGTFPSQESENSFFGSIELGYKKKFSKNLALKFSPVVHFNRFAHSEGEKFYVRTLNSGIFFREGSHRLSAGFLTHKFGFSQLFSPIDFIDTTMLWNPLAPERITSPSIRYMYKKSGWRFFATYFPIKFENLLPGDESPWLPKQLPNSIQTGTEEIIFNRDPIYEFRDSEEIDNSLTNNFTAGLRYKNKHIVTQLIFYEGLDTDPVVDLDLTLNTISISPDRAEVLNPIGVVPINQRVSRAGFGIRYTTPIKWRLLYEGNISRGDPNTRQGARRTESHTYGLEWGVPLGKTLLLGVVQGFYGKSSNQSRIGIVSPFRKAVLLGLMWEYKGLKLQAGYLDSSALGINVINGLVGYKFSKEFSLEVRGDFLGGDVDEILSGVIDSDFISAKIRYKF